MEPTDICWNTGRFTDDCDCEMCDHKDECSGNDNHDDDDE